MLRRPCHVTLEERVADLEGQVSEQSHAVIDIRDALRRLEERIDARFDSTDRRIDGIDDRVSRCWESLSGKMSRQFVWLVGMQVTTLAAILVAVVGALVSLG